MGFIPIRGHWSDKENEGPREKNETYFYDEMQLLEISVVNIPANGNANKKGEGEVEDELNELRALAPKPKETTDERPVEMSLDDQMKLTMAAAEAAL